MSEDYGTEYGKMVVRATKAGCNDVVMFLNNQAKMISDACQENKSLMDENTRLHDVNDELHTYLAEERKRLKPDGPLVSRKVLLMAVELLEDGGVIYEWSDMGKDLRYEIKQVTQHEEDGT